jgi:hypothetical protein
MNAPVFLRDGENAEAIRDLAWWAYHRDGAGRCAVAEIEPERLTRLRRLMADNVSLDRTWAELNANRPTPNATIEAVKQGVRDRGLAALKETATRARLAGFGAAARAELDRWLTHFKTKARV